MIQQLKSGIRTRTIVICSCLTNLQNVVYFTSAKKVNINKNMGNVILCGIDKSLYCFLIPFRDAYKNIISVRTSPIKFKVYIFKSLLPLSVLLLKSHFLQLDTCVLNEIICFPHVVILSNLQIYTDRLGIPLYQVIMWPSVTTLLHFLGLS